MPDNQEKPKKVETAKTEPAISAYDKALTDLDNRLKALEAAFERWKAISGVNPR